MLSAILAKITAAPESLSPAEWVEKHVQKIPYSPRAGALKLSPIQTAVLKAITDKNTRTVSIIACVQSGKSLASELALAWLIANEPGPAMWLDLTDESAKDQSEGRLQALFGCCAPVKNLFNVDKNKMRKSTMIFSNGMTLWAAGALNKRNLQRRSIKYIFGDETWLWEPGRMAEAEARTTAFRGGKCVFLSQAGFCNDDTDRKFRSTSAARWHLRCTECRKLFAPEIGHLEWNDEKDVDGKRNFDAVANSARLICPHCGNAFRFSEKQLYALNAGGEFVASNPGAPEYAKGFSWNAFAFTDWGQIAAMYLQAKDAANRGDVSDLRAFYQKRLAQPWDSGDSEANALVETSIPEGNFRLRENWEREAGFDTLRAQIVPANLRTAGTFPLRFLTVDVQLNHFYWIVRSWDERGNSRLLDCGIAQTFADIRNIADANRIFPVFVGIDSGFEPERVFRFCAENNFTALRGSPKHEWTFDRAGKTRRPFSPREFVDCGNGQTARRHFFSNLRIKDILHTVRSGNTEISWEIPSDTPANYLQMLSSERRNDEKQIWEQIGNRPNHFFDCETMNLATAAMLGIIG